MTARHRSYRVIALALVLALLPVGATARAAANPAYSKVASAFAIGGGHLDPCAFSEAQLKAALAGIPQSIARTVPDLKKAIRDGIAAHERGACKGRKPSGVAGSVSGGGSAAPPETTTPTTSAAPPPSTTVPGATTTPTQPATTTTPAPLGQVTQPAVVAHERDRTPLLIAAIALGGLLLAALLLWGLARLRGWDPAWAARSRHAWREAGFRTAGTWSEFADWLRLGR